MQSDTRLDEHRAALSSLMDGDVTDADGACRAWCSEAQARADWHAYHLIGDVLRSDEHRCDASHDARFVAQVRQKLAAEPTVLAPQPQRVAAPRRVRARAWMAPTAVTAGFVAVAGVLAVTRVGVPDGALADRSLVAGGAGSPATVVVAAPIDVTKTPLLRSAELDRYLAAHREVANASALAAPGGVMRSAAVAAPGR